MIIPNTLYILKHSYHMNFTYSSLILYHLNSNQYLNYVQRHLVNPILCEPLNQLDKLHPMRTTQPSW